ncbi:unnamed protein product [Phytophthora fragariaefolia]|uniref:Unnamed protein product n=1 Tax=Phytophthora fragariaefolia TaxID=1490495 RepID=A0A9W6TYH3_9STRA|nr:unnamed protein product [Phytophthora fragariaefolia]
MSMVAIRQPTSSSPAHVLVPAQIAWDSLISRNEYIVGWCTGGPQPAATAPTVASRLQRDEVPTGVTTNTAPAAFSTSVAAGTTAPVISDAVLATLMSLAQSTQQMLATTQQMLATTQQLHREQRDLDQASIASLDRKA